MSKIIKALARQVKFQFSSQNPIIVNGRKHQQVHEKKLLDRVASQISTNNLIREPSLAIIEVGQNVASNSYLKANIAACKRVGINYQTFSLCKNTTEEELIELIEQLNQDDNVDSIMCHLPLPGHINSEEILETIDVNKDVEQIKMNQQNQIIPCAPNAILWLLVYYNIDLNKLNTTILGYGKTVGEPLHKLLQDKYEDANINIVDENTENYSLSESDLIISATGIRHIVKGQSIKSGAIVLDLGANQGIKGKDKSPIVGDVEFEEALKKAALITPVPGGIGPITISMLIKNVITQWEINYLKNQESITDEDLY